MTSVCIGQIYNKLLSFFIDSKAQGSFHHGSHLNCRNNVYNNFCKQVNKTLLTILQFNVILVNCIPFF